jgi:hypothetical protein
MFAAIQAQAGGVSQRVRFRAPTPVDQQTVIRMNRDTRYSAAVADISAGARLTIPDTGRRYVSVMIANQDHYVSRVFHDPGGHDLMTSEYGTPHVLAAARMLADPADPGDIASVSALHDQLGLKAGSAQPFALPDYDQASPDATRGALLKLARGLRGLEPWRARRRTASCRPASTASGRGGAGDHVARDPRRP